MSFFEIQDPAFGRFVMGNAPVKQLATGFDWVNAALSLISARHFNRISR